MNRLTGELLELQPYGAGRGGGGDEAPSWSTIYLPAWDAVITTPDVTFAELRILLRLCVQAPIGECQPVAQARLARALGLHRHTVRRGFDRLVGRGWIVRDPSDRTCCWVSPDLAYRGRKGERADLRKRLTAVPTAAAR